VGCSGYGAAIDAHDVVFRTNMAPTEGYADDVGGRTTFDVINLQVMFAECSPNVH
jgi:hypothetical protein